MACECWSKEWDRWNTRDVARCGQRPAEYEPDPKICACRCHELECDYLLTTRRWLDLVREKATLTLRIHNLEETYEPVPFGGGPTICRCDPKERRMYCRICKGEDERTWERT